MNSDASSSRSESRKVACHWTRCPQAKMWGVVSVDVVVREVDRETMHDVDDSTFQAAFGKQAVVRIVPGSIHGKGDAIDQTLVVAVE